MALPVKVRLRDVRRRAREQVSESRNQQAVGAIGAAAVSPYVIERVPQIGPLPKRIVAGAGLLVAGAMLDSDYARGAGTYLLARGIEELTEALG